MPRSKNNPIDRSRQALINQFKAINRAANKARKKRAAQKQKAIDKDILAKARALKKAGLYNPKENPTLSNLTPSKKRQIKKTFNKVQRHSRFLEDAGRTVRPFQKVEKVSKSGRIYEQYKINDYYHLLRTKRKTKVPSGTIKTRKGYIIEKSKPSAKVRINNKGEIVESYNVNGKHVVNRRRGYKGGKILKLVNDIESGNFKLHPNQYLLYKKWGSEVQTAFFDYDRLQDFAELVHSYELTMPINVFEAWLEKSEILIRTEK